MNASPIHAKSAKGLAELEYGGHGLDLKSRQVLILADGRNTVARIQQLRPGLDVQGIINRLLADGFLQGGGAVASPAAPPVAIVAPEPKPVAPEKLDEARTIMVESTRQHIGILGGELARKISTAEDSGQIRNCIAQWNMAMRESRQGRPMADQLLREVHLALGMKLA